MMCRAICALVLVAGCHELPEPNPARWRSVPGGGRTRIGPQEPECLQRGTAEFATWLQMRAGMRVTGAMPVVGLAAGLETTLPVALNDNLRIGPWLQLGGDTLDLVHAQGGLSVVLGGLPDAKLVPSLAASHAEGALGLQLGLGWRGAGGLDHRSDGAELDVKLTFGSRRYTEVGESGNAYDACDGSMRALDHAREVWIGHYGAGFAYGHRVFVQLERPLDRRGTQIVLGVEFDPVTLGAVRRVEREAEFLREHPGYDVIGDED